VRITDVVVTPIAFRDPPLLNAAGVHEPLALRTVVQVVTETGVVGLGEGRGDSSVVRGLEAVRSAVVGLDVHATTRLEAAVGAALGGGRDTASLALRRMVTAPLEVACHDAWGKELGLPVSELLGGAVRERVEFSAYLFYKWAHHPGADPADDLWGEALDPEGVVAQARRMVDLHGFRSIKLKGGVMPPDEEVAAVRALAEAFPDHPLRIDPNGAWGVETSLRVAAELDGVLEYLEDPTTGLDGMSAVARGAAMPLATNMVVVAPEQVREAVEKDSVQVVLSDHHIWGGLRRSRELAATCAALGIGVSMHSNSHLGISLAAMTHLAAASPNLDYASDTHYPWNSEDDVVRGAPLRFVDGALQVPPGPGLGVELDEDALAQRHRTYVESGRTDRDDATYLRTVRPDFDPVVPRW